MNRRKLSGATQRRPLISDSASLAPVNTSREISSARSQNALEELDKTTTLFFRTKVLLSFSYYKLVTLAWLLEVLS